MKKILSTVFLTCIVITVFSQSPVGLIAHWDMNGQVNDVSGHGHNGHASNITSAAGKDGVLNTAYYFNGTNSVITAPYLPDLNLTNYSICAVVNVQGFYSGACQANAIFDRGKFYTPGNYMLYFVDNPFDGNNCSAVDSTKDVFTMLAGQNAAPFVDWQYSPQIVKNKWYKVVGTWDGIKYQMYVNDTLKSTVYRTSGTMGTSTDSISIGMDIFEPAYPYRFKGFIDDIIIYDRVLSDTEIHYYGDTCNVAPISGILNVCVGSTIQLSNITPNGTWSSGNAVIATIASSSGIGNGVSAGVTIITYATIVGCVVTASVTVSNIPSVISGNTTLCQGSAIALSNAIAGGMWSSGTSTVATVTTNTGIATGIGAGSAIISYSTVTGSSGCTVTTSITVNPPAQAITGSTLLCIGTTTTLSNAPGGTWSSAATGIATVSATGGVSGIAAGPAIISYTNSAGCFDTALVTVYAPPGSISGSLSLCLGTSTLLSNAGSGGVWSSNNTNVATIVASGTGQGTITGVDTGTTLVSYTVPPGCFTTASITVKPLPPAITGNTQVCVGSTTILSNAANTGTWSSGSTGIATVNATTGVVTGVATGTATISYSTAAGCFETKVVTVNQAPAVIVGPTTVCVGSTIKLSDATTGGTWSSTNTSYATVIPSGTGQGTMTGVSPGPTVIAYTLAGGCARTLTVTVNLAPSAITGNTQVCAGSTTVLSNAVNTGTWSSGSTGFATVNTATGVVTGVAAGPAIISYSTAAGCFDTIVVTINPVPQAILGLNSICLGSTIRLSDATSGGTWSSSNTAFATIIPSGTGQGTATGLSSGTTVISYTLPGGCARTLSVTVNPAPSVITGNTLVCTGAITPLSNTVNSGMWTSAATSVATVNASSGVVSGASAGTAVISYFIGTCIVTTTVTVNVTPSVSAGTPNICTDGTAVLSAAPGGGTWTSSNTSVATVAATGSATALVTGIDTGGTTITYSVSGCSGTTILKAVAILPPVSGAALVCTGNSIILSNAIIGGTWTSSSTTVLVDPSSGIVTGMTAGSATITYSIGGTCKTATTVTVALTPDPGIITGPSALCEGATITLSNTVSGGTWTVSNTSATVTNGSVAAIATGTDTIMYIVTNGTCKDTALKIVNIYTVPDAGVITGPSSVCAGSIIALSNTVVNGVWSSANTAIASVNTNGRITGISAGTDTISYVVSNPGCSSVVTHTLTIHSLPSAGAVTGPAIVCPGATFVLSNAVTGGIWNSGNTAAATINSNTGSILTTATGTVTITYTTGPNSGGCYAHALFTFSVTTATFTVDTLVSQVKCHGDNNGNISVTVNGATGALLYTWSNDSITSSVSGLAPGQYILNIFESGTQCTSSDSFIITEPDSLIAVAHATMDICKAGNGSITTSVSGGTQPYTYLWSINTTGADLQNIHSGIYTLNITDVKNCEQTLSVTVKDTCGGIVVHDAVTPNGDGVNDTWVIEGIQDYPQNTVSVFDKWGDAVFEKTGYTNNWAATGKSGLLPDGTYFYIVKLPATALKGENILTGSIIIKR